MNDRREDASLRTVLRGAEGELVSVRVKVDPRSLEDLLEALAGLDFPINPEIRHTHPSTVVEFPAYEKRLRAIERTIERSGLGAEIELASMLQAIA